jgi:hypothetical protein
MRTYLCVVAMMMTAGCADEPTLPPVIASSEYLIYHSESETTQLLCFEERLARDDRFIERTAALLGVAPPTGPIHFIWDSTEEPRPWDCSVGVGCYRHYEDDGYALIVSERLGSNHELVHAVEIPALGPSGGSVLGEGIAEYLGSSSSTASVVGDFPARFKAALAADEEVADYQRSMHFVGSIFAAHGADKYRELRRQMPRTAGPDEFAAAYQSVYGEPLDAALAAMTTPVTGIEGQVGCDEGDALALAWTSPGLIDVELASECGDGAFYFGTYDPARPLELSHHALFVVEIAEAGRYDLTVSATDDAPGPVYGALRPCAGAEGEVGSTSGLTGHAVVTPGRFVLELQYTSRPEPRGEARVRLEYIGPP